MTNAAGGGHAGRVDLRQRVRRLAAGGGRAGGIGPLAVGPPFVLASAGGVPQHRCGAAVTPRWRRGRVGTCWGVGNRPAALLPAGWCDPSSVAPDHRSEGVFQCVNNRQWRVALSRAAGRPVEASAVSSRCAVQPVCLHAGVWARAGASRDAHSHPVRAGPPGCCSALAARTARRGTGRPARARPRPSSRGRATASSRCCMTGCGPSALQGAAAAQRPEQAHSRPCCAVHGFASAVWSTLFVLAVQAESTPPWPC